MAYGFPVYNNLKTVYISRKKHAEQILKKLLTSGFT